MTLSEVQEISGEPGNFTVKLRKNPRHIDVTKCTGCGDCGVVNLDQSRPPKEAYEELLVDRVIIDEAKCIQCGECVKACTEENEENQRGMTSAFRQNLLGLPTPADAFPQFSEKGDLLQKLMKMSVQERVEFWQEQFKKCIKCYGCVDACPVQVGGAEELEINHWVPTGQVPPPFPMFHLIRAYQVWNTCVACGECEMTCPAQIPLKTLQDIVRYFTPEQVFEMVPGLDESARQAIVAFVASRGPSRRLSYAV